MECLTVSSWFQFHANFELEPLAVNTNFLQELAKKFLFLFCPFGQLNDLILKLLILILRGELEHIGNLFDDLWDELPVVFFVYCKVD